MCMEYKVRSVWCLIPLCMQQVHLSGLPADCWGVREANIPLLSNSDQSPQISTH
jgi:hypothetical protein